MSPELAPEELRKQVALGRVIREHELRERVEAEPEAVLTELGITGEDQAGMLSYGPERLLAYHHMAQSRLFRTIRAFLGGAATRMGDERLRDEVRQWMTAQGSQRQYLREVPEEFLRWAAPRWAEDESLPPWLVELAGHELLKRQLRNDPREVGEQNQIKIDLEKPIACNGTTRLLRYRWAVHRMLRRPEPDAEADAPEAGEFAVIAYRHKDEQPRFVDVKPRSAFMLERLLAGQTLREALFGACESTGETLNDEILEVTALTLADLVERHVLLGGVGS